MVKFLLRSRIFMASLANDLLGERIPMSQALPAPDHVVSDLQKLTFKILFRPSIFAGLFVLACLLDKITGLDGYQLNDAALAIAFLTTALAAWPFIRFINTGWDSRYSEIRNRLNRTSLFAYLVQFWEQRFRDKCEKKLPDDIRDCGPKHVREFGGHADQLFEEIYEDQYNRWAFLFPVFLVLVTVAAETMLIVFAATPYPPADPAIADPYAHVHAYAPDFAEAWPAFGAMCGTYMFVVGDSVMAVRRRTLNISDVYWYALRLVLAVPLGIVVARADGGMIGAFVLGTLPIDQFRKVLSRYAGKNFIDLEAAQTTDQLIQLEGVTADISAIIGLEGITSIEQLLGADPVSLAIRTGLPFKLMLRLGSQAVVRRHLGMGATALVPIGLADAEPVAHLVRKYSTKQGKKTLVDAAALGADKVVVDAVGLINNFATSKQAEQLRAFSDQSDSVGIPDAAGF